MVVPARLGAHLQARSFHTTFQSAYKPNHSSETALICVQSDILKALDQGSYCILVMLDLSAAFDTLDHTTLLTTCSIKEVALNWRTSSIQDRHETVIINGKRSQPVQPEYGVPQGWVLGPKLYSLYTKPLAYNLEDKESSHHFFADDTKLCQFFQTKCAASPHQAVTSIEALKTPLLQMEPLWHLFPSRLVTQRFRVRRLSET